MSVAPISNTYHRPFFQAAFTPIQLIYGIFLKAMGCLLLFLGAKEWGESLKSRGEKIDSQCASLFVGLWAYGRRFLVHGDNSQKSCRGSCYWMVDQHFKDPEKPLIEIAKVFEEGAPLDAIAMHKDHMIPANLVERRVWSEWTAGAWPPMPQLDPGVYLFLVGYSKDANTHGKAHLFALFKEEKSFLFDPDTGLSEWLDTDWTPLLDRIGSDIRSSKAGYFTLECDSCRAVLH